METTLTLIGLLLLAGCQLASLVLFALALNAIVEYFNRKVKFEAETEEE